MQTDTELQRLIDRALSSYSDASPSAGLEARVLNRIRAAQIPTRSFTPLRWALALALPALMCIAIVVRLQHRPPQMAAIASVPIASVPDRAATARERSTLPDRAATARERSTRFFRRLARPSPLPEQEQFPAPAPLSGEERLLLAFVKRDPNDAVRAFANLAKRTADPLEIEPVEIKPLSAQDDCGPLCAVKPLSAQGDCGPLCAARLSTDGTR